MCYREYLVKLFVLFERKQCINSASKYKTTFLPTHKHVAWTVLVVNKLDLKNTTYL